MVEYLVFFGSVPLHHTATVCVCVWWWWRGMGGDFAVCVCVCVCACVCVCVCVCVLCCAQMVTFGQFFSSKGKDIAGWILRILPATTRRMDQQNAVLWLCVRAHPDTPDVLCFSGIFRHDSIHAQINGTHALFVSDLCPRRMCVGEGGGGLDNLITVVQQQGLHDNRIKGGWCMEPVPKASMQAVQISFDWTGVRDVS